MSLYRIIESDSADVLIIVLASRNMAMDYMNIVVGHALIRVAVNQWLLLRVIECVDLLEIFNHLLHIIVWLLSIELHVLGDERLCHHFFVVCSMRLVERSVDGIRVVLLFDHELAVALWVIILRVHVRIHAL